MYLEIQILLKVDFKEKLTVKSIEEVLSSYSHERPNNFYFCIMVRDDSDLLHIVSYPYIMCGEVCKVVAVKRVTTKGYRVYLDKKGFVSL